MDILGQPSNQLSYLARAKYRFNYSLAGALEELKFTDQFPNLSSGESTHYLIALLGRLNQIIYMQLLTHCKCSINVNLINMVEIFLF